MGENIDSNIIETNILFVDAETSVLESIKRMLMDVGKQAYFASTFDEAMNIIKEKEINTMVVDITSNSLEDILDKVQESNPSIVKVVISDFAHLSKIINSIRRLNLHSFLLKPWKKTELFEALSSAEEYSAFLKNQVREKENLAQKNVIYQRIISFKDNVGSYNKIDINSLKTSLFLQAGEYENVLNNNSLDKNLAFKAISSASEMFSMAFPTFLEKFTVKELISELGSDNTSINCANPEVSYTKNLVLIKELISRLSKFLYNFHDTNKIEINIYPEDKLCVRFDFVSDKSKLEYLDLLLKYLNKLLLTLECSLDYTLTEQGSNLTLMF